VQITEIRCVELTGPAGSPEIVWDGRCAHPADPYPELRRVREAEWERANDGPTRTRLSFVEIEAEDGSVGRAGPISGDQAWVIGRKLAPMLAGADALATERQWEVMYRSLAAHGRTGLEMTALSVVDCALWDLRGRHFGVPVWRLLGGPIRERIPVYVTTLGSSVEPERAAVAAAAFSTWGFAGQKWFPQFGPAAGRDGLRRNLELVRAVREAVGPEVRLMIDAWMSWDVEYTLEFARGAADCDLYWIEDPVMPERLDGLAELARRLAGGPAIAAGERFSTRWQFAQLADAGVRVLQPEVFWSGGFTELLKIAAAASVRPVTVVPHGTSVATSAHFAFAQPATLVPMLEYMDRPNAVWQSLFTEPLIATDGHVELPQSPGLGTDLDESRIEDRRVLPV
jgi:L-rhamnonate dehydratase